MKIWSISLIGQMKIQCMSSVRLSEKEASEEGERGKGREGEKVRKTEAANNVPHPQGFGGTLTSAGGTENLTAI